LKPLPLLSYPERSERVSDYLLRCSRRPRRAVARCALLVVVFGRRGRGADCRPRLTPACGAALGFAKRSRVFVVALRQRRCRHSGVGCGANPWSHPSLLPLPRGRFPRNARPGDGLWDGRGLSTSLARWIATCGSLGGCSLLAAAALSGYGTFESAILATIFARWVGPCGADWYFRTTENVPMIGVAVFVTSAFSVKEW
jgi:hypothetical protein